jgi:hypothetical protein
MKSANTHQANRQSRTTPFAVVAGAALLHASAHPETDLSNEDMGLDIPAPTPPVQPLQPDSGTKLVDPDNKDVPR